MPISKDKLVVECLKPMTYAGLSHPQLGSVCQKTGTSELEVYENIVRYRKETLEC